MYNPADYTRGMGVETMTAERAVSAVLKNVYGWMALALALTATVAMGLASWPGFMPLLAQNSLLLWLPMILELGIVIYMTARLEKMSFGSMAILMAVYSALNGVTMSFIFFAYTTESIASTFWVCAATFGVMAFLGHTTSTDMTSWGKYFMMCLVGIIVASLVNMFMHSDGLSLFLSYAGVLLFVGLTAYDAQKIKKAVEYNHQMGTLDMRKLALWGSLTLYLDFINLFLYLLRIMGNRRD